MLYLNDISSKFTDLSVWFSEYKSNIWFVFDCDTVSIKFWILQQQKAAYKHHIQIEVTGKDR